MASTDLGPVRALWLLSRPAFLPLSGLLVLAGYGWAHWDRALSARGGSDLPPLLAGWVLLNAATLWLNAVTDRDEGEVLFGRSVPAPPHTAWIARGSLVVSVALCWFADPVAGLSAAVCAALAELYSHPSTLWKGHPILGPMVNFVGYGLLTPLVGWSVVDVKPNPRTVAVWLLVAVALLGLYFAAQAFQGDEDRARGYRTLVATHGPGVTLRWARRCMLAASFGGLVMALAGWLPRICLVGVPAFVWVDLWLRRWGATPGGGDEAWARGFTSRLIGAGLFGLLLTTGDYLRQSFSGEPVAGLGTAAGHPADRPRLPPWELREWEERQQHVQ